MSSRVQGYVWDACAANDIKGAKLLIMVRLADYSNDDGISYPGVETISRQIGLAESTIYGALSELEKAGWVKRQARRKGNRRNSNIYYLNIERLERLAMREREKVRALNAAKRANFQPPEFEGTDFEPPEYSFEPPESGLNRGGEPPESGGDPQVKHDLQDRDPQETRARPAKKSAVFDPLTAKPANVSSQVWADWVSHRREIRKPLTETSCRLQAKKLAGHPDPDAVITLSIACGWTGLFPDKTQSGYREHDCNVISSPTKAIPPGFMG